MKTKGMCSAMCIFTSFRPRILGSGVVRKRDTVKVAALQREVLAIAQDKTLDPHNHCEKHAHDG
jgi:hypothetical protein